MPVEAGEENIRVRVKSPGLFKKGSFRTITISKKRGIKAVIGKLKGQTNTTVQTYIFDKKKWTVAKAKKWVADRKKKKKEGAMDFEAEVTNVTNQIIEKSDGKDVKHSGAQLISYIPMGATSFEDVDEYIKGEETHLRIKEVTRQFQDLVWNIMASIDIDDKQAALKSLMAELDERLGDALTLKEKSFTNRLKSWLGFEKESEPEQEKEQGLMIWKEGERYRWMAIYSNKYRDEDLPPEIISEAAHLTFVKEVEAGTQPYPELWHWHIPGTRWGIADMLTYDKDNGFTLASGLVDVGHEKEAEAVMAMEDPIRTSHGMPEEFIKREDEDDTVITGYVSREISDLPANAAANKLTGFSIIKEVKEMSIPDDKKEYLRLAGLSDEQITSIESQLGEKAKVAEDANLEFKETPPEEVPAEEPATEEPEKEETPIEAEQSVTREEVAEAIVETVAPLQEAVAEIGKSILELVKDDEEKIAEKAEDVPAASIAAIIARNMRAVGSEDAKLEKGAKVKGPKQEKPDKPATGIGFIDKMIAEDKK